MSLTISGVITASGTTLSGSTLVSGSHYVNYTYTYTIPSLNGSYVCADAVMPSGLLYRYDDNLYCRGNLLLYTQNVGEPIGLSPLDIKDGLIAWHTFNETSNVYDDWSPNDYRAYDYGTTGILAHQGYGRSVSEGPSGYIDVPVLPSGLSTYMCSFWFKPTVTLTSGNSNSFRIFTAEPFCGDHFANSIDYKAYSPVKGWYLLNTTTTCQAGSNGTYLRMQGASNTNWLGSTWTASTIYFKISKNTDWDIETKFNMGPLSDGQSAGIIFFNLSSYLNYASLQFKNTGGFVADTDQTVAMTSNTAPSPYSVTATSEWDANYRAYKAFDHLNDAYGWCSAYVLPHSIMYNFGSTGYNINKYRFRAVNANSSGGFPKDFTLYGNAVPNPSVSNDADWVQIDYQVGIAWPGQATWTSWFDIDNPGSYTSYRVKVTAVSSDTFAWIGEIEFASAMFELGNIDVLVQTGTYSYTAIDDITSPAASANFRLRMLKRGNTIKFKYCNPSENKWYDTIYEVDTSLWGSNMAIGLQSRNAVGTSPVVNFDYVSFEKGKKPPELGDLEAPGRFVVSYNETSVSGAVGSRDDGRIWLETKRDGVAYGTAQHYWDPDTWYLLQAGVDSAGNYCWWVNSHLEKGITVGSGVGIGTQFLTGSGMKYFDASNPPVTSGSFILDEVSHWSRWLTSEEILKLTNKVSQVQMIYTTGYHSADVNISNALISYSGSVATRSITKDLGFYYFGEYQCPTPGEVDVKFEKVSYRIQKDMIIVAQELNPFIVNIARCSSGWLANQMGCFGCMMTRSGGDNRCQCLVFEELSIYALGEKRVNEPFQQIPATTTAYAYDWLFNTEIVRTDYVQATYDFQSPKIYSVDPENHSRMLDPDLNILDFSEFELYTKDYGSTFAYDSNRVWINRDNKGYSTYTKSDNFSFYEMDLLATGSGYGWSIMNPNNSERVYINEGFSSKVDIDYSQVVASGVKEVVTSSGLDYSIKLVKDLSYHYKPTCEVYGTNYLDVITQSGSWTPERTKRDAPFSYFTLPSGLQDWEVKTKLRMNFSGDYRGQYSGLMLSSPDKTEFVQLLNTASGVICRSHTGRYSTPAINTGISLNGWIWLKMKKYQNSLYCYWSPNGTTWSGIEPFSYLVNSVPTLSGNPVSYPLINADDYETDIFYPGGPLTYYPWCAFDTNVSGTMWMSRYLPCWISVDYGQPKMIYGYKYYPPDYNTRFRILPVNSKLQGSLDNVNWVTLNSVVGASDPGPGNALPSNNSYYSIRYPGNYRYYRFYIETSTNIPGSGWGPQISTLILLTSSGINFNVSRNLLVGATVVSDRDWTISPTTSGLLPVLTSNTSPSPFVASSSSDFTAGTAYRPFANSSWSSSSTALLPQWLKIDLGKACCVRAFSYTRSASPHFYFQGSVDDVAWETLHSITDAPTTLTGYIQLDNTKYYRYYRFYFAGYLALGNYVSLSNVTLYGFQDPIAQVNFPARTQSIFDYMSVTTSGGIDNIPLVGDPWEQILDSATPINSASNSGLTAYSQIDTQTYKLTWRPLVPLTQGDQVYYRVQSQDSPTFKIGYDVSPDTLLFIPATDLNSNVVDSTFGATASSYQTVDESDYRQKMYSYVSYSDGSTNTSVDYITPAMTSNNGPSPFRVLYSSVYSASYDAYMAFDRNINSFWHSNSGLPQWIGIDLGSPKVINKYKIARRTYADHIPYDWLFQGSKDGSQWVTLHSVTNATYGADYWNPSFYTFSLDTSYQYYRLYVTRTSSTYVNISEILLVENTGGFIPVRGSVATVTGTKYLGTGSLYFPRYNWIQTDTISGNLSVGDWTFNTWYYPNTVSGNLLSIISPVTGSGLVCSVHNTSMDFYLGESYLGSNSPFTLASGSWYNIGIMREKGWIYTYINGTRSANSTYIGESEISTFSGSIIRLGGQDFVVYLDMVKLDLGAQYLDSLIYSNTLDDIITFNVASILDLSTEIGIVNDTDEPTILPVAPVPYAERICPSSGIVFDIVDDFSGVKWTELLIKMNDITVWSGGNNMTEWFDDRGILTYEDLGHIDGEWDNIQISEDGVVYTDGPNRLLYPPGTVYSGSGAWGRRFTYYVPEITEMGYFGARMTVTITGTDNVGYLSRFDDKFPNTFSGQYYFDFIPNDNIRFDDVFMHKGQSMRIDEMEARGIHFWVDLFDSNYPSTDIVEDNCTVTWWDGVNEFVCSGIWFTTWTGVTASGDDVYFHRLHWDPGNHWDWIGNRAIHLTVESHNSDTTCDVYNREEYILFYGWQLNWWHQAVPGLIPPFDFGKKFPVFVSMKTYDFAPSRGSLSWMYQTPAGYTFDLPVYIKPKPIDKKDLKVGILAHSHYLQYSEDVEVEVTCKDLDGNELVYSWTFRTEDQP